MPPLAIAAPDPGDRKRLTLQALAMLDTYRERGPANRATWLARMRQARTKARELHDEASTAFLGLDTQLEGASTPFIAAVTLALFAYYREARAYTFGALLDAACEACEVDPRLVPHALGADRART